MQHATAKKKANAVITQQQSMHMIMKMMRVSFHIIAAMRRIFPQKCFDSKTYLGTKYDGLKGYTGNKQADTYHDWIEQGLQDALRKRYLDKCFLEIYRKQKDRSFKIIEIYVFHVSYTNEGAELHLTQGDTSNPNDCSRSTVKNDVKNIVSTLFDVARDLDPLPTKRMLAMRLFYNQRAPEDYQAPQFRATIDKERLVMNSKPLEKCIGSVLTPHHKSDFLILLADDNLDDSDSDEYGQYIPVAKTEPGPAKQSLQKSRLKKKTAGYHGWYKLDDADAGVIENEPDDDDDDDDSLFVDDIPHVNALAQQSSKKPQLKRKTTGEVTTGIQERQQRNTKRPRRPENNTRAINRSYTKARKSPTAKKTKLQGEAFITEATSKPRTGSQAQRNSQGAATKRTQTVWTAYAPKGAEGFAKKRIFQG